MTIHVFENGKLHSFSIRDPINESTKGEKQEELSEGNLIAPMPGKVVKVFVKKGDRVKSGNPLVIMEAMKMEHILRAPFDGVVESIAAKDGDFIQNGKLVVSISAN